MSVKPRLCRRGRRHQVVDAPIHPGSRLVDRWSFGSPPVSHDYSHCASLACRWNGAREGSCRGELGRVTPVPVVELADEERARLLERYGRRLSAGEVVYSEGEAAEHCFLIEDGRARLVKHVRASERSLTVLRPGDLFGEDALIEGATRSSSAVALTDLTVLALDRATFGILLSGNSDVARRFVQQLVRRLRDAEEQLENAMLRDHPSRVINTLLRLARPDEAGHAVRVSPLELSSRVGLDVDAVKRAVQQLRDGGYLRIVQESILIPDLGALQQLYELLGKKEGVRGGLS